MIDIFFLFIDLVSSKFKVRNAISTDSQMNEKTLTETLDILKKIETEIKNEVAFRRIKD